MQLDYFIQLPLKRGLADPVGLPELACTTAKKSLYSLPSHGIYYFYALEGRSTFSKQRPCQPFAGA
jgi:hypothetical protein